LNHQPAFLFDGELNMTTRNRTMALRPALWALVVALPLLGSCAKRGAASPAAARREGGGAVPVTVAPVQQKTTAVEVSRFGTVEPYSMVDVRSQITGILTEVHFVEGQQVKKGDLLLSIDPRQPVAALKAAQANLEGHQAQLKNAETEANRKRQLLEKGFIAQDELDQITTSVDTLRASVSADLAAVENAGLQLDYCSVRSPIDGRTGSLHLHAGNVVRANDVSVVTVMQTEPIYVSFWVPEEFLPAIRKGMAKGELDVRVTLARDEGEPMRGVLSLIENTADVDNHTIRLRATLANKDQRLWPGQYVDTVLTVSQEPNSLVVPSVAVQTGQNNQFVYVVKPDQTVEARPITVRRGMDEETVVEGIKAGEVVVTDGHLRLVPGARIQVKDAGQGR
jgi:membrane fusion protein, multidrug efflux system